MPPATTPAGDLQSVTPAQLVGHVKSALSKGDPTRPAFTLIIGAGFSYGLVPLTREMMRQEVGPWMREEPDADPDKKKALTVDFWRQFNAENQQLNTGCRVDVDADGLPSNPTAAYQMISRADAIGGIGTVEEARRFLRGMVARSRGRLNGAHFFLAALLDAQRRGELKGKRPFCRTIFTTNFDAILQTSLQLMGVLYYMTDRPELSLTASHMVEDDDAIHLIYTHGSVHRPYLANTEEELQQLRGNAPVFAPYLEGHGVIALGYSGWDDSIVAALQQCTNFAANLYWCDILPSPDASKNLSEPARRLLANGRGRRFYVPLGAEGADGLMGQLFQELSKNQSIPRVLIDPFAGLGDQLRGLSLKGITLKRYANVPAAAAPAGGAAGTQALDTAVTGGELFEKADDLLTRAVDAVASASRGLRHPATADGNADPLNHIQSAALERAFAGELDDAILLWDTVIKFPGAPAEQVAGALYNRGVSYFQQGKIDLAIADYSKAIGLQGARPDQVTGSLNNRGTTYVQLGKLAEAMADYTAAIDLPGAPADQVARALYNRGVTYGQQGKMAEALDDYTSAIDLPDAPPEQVARGLNNRGTLFAQQNRPDDAIGDYTRVIELPGAPPDQVARALYNRGVTYSQREARSKALADYTRAIELPGAPIDQVAMTLNNRGITYGQMQDAVKEIADYTRVIEMSGAPVDQVALALNNRAITYGQQDKPEDELADYARVIDLPGAPANQIAIALNNRAIVHRQRNEIDRALADYARVIALPGAPAEQLAKAHHNRGSLRYQDGEGDRAGFLSDAAAAVELTPSATTLANLGLANLFAGKDEAAAEAYQRFLKAGPPAAERDAVQAVLSAARAKWLDEKRAAPILKLLDPEPRSAPKKAGRKAAASPPPS